MGAYDVFADAANAGALKVVLQGSERVTAPDSASFAATVAS